MLVSGFGYVTSLPAAAQPHRQPAASPSGRHAAAATLPIVRRSSIGGSGSSSRRRCLAAVVARAVAAEPEGLTQTAFEDMLRMAPTPAVLVDFYTTWCGPCKVLDKNVKAVLPAHKESVTFVKIDTEKNPEVADHYAVSKLPTLMLFKGGMQVDRYEGLLSGQDLDMRLRRFLK